MALSPRRSIVAVLVFNIAGSVGFGSLTDFLGQTESPSPPPFETECDANSVPTGAGGDFCTCNPGYACSTCGTYPCVGDNDTLSEDVWGCNLTLWKNTNIRDRMLDQRTLFGYPAQQVGRPAFQCLLTSEYCNPPTRAQNYSTFRPECNRQVNTTKYIGLQCSRSGLVCDTSTFGKCSSFILYNLAAMGPQCMSEPEPEMWIGTWVILVVVFIACSCCIPVCGAVCRWAIKTLCKGGRSHQGHDPGSAGPAAHAGSFSPIRMQPQSQWLHVNPATLLPGQMPTAQALAPANSVPKITMMLQASTSLTKLELAALKDGFLDKLEDGLRDSSNGPFDRSNIAVGMSAGVSTGDSFVQATAFFKPGSGVDIGDAYAIAAAIKYEGSFVARRHHKGSLVTHHLVFGDPSVTHAVPPEAPEIMAPSFSQAAVGAGTVPRINMVLEGDSASLAETDLAALKVGVLDTLQNASNTPFDRANILVELTANVPVFQAKAYFKPGSGVDFSGARAIAAAIGAAGYGPANFVTHDHGTTRHLVFGEPSAEHAMPPGAQQQRRPSKVYSSLARRSTSKRGSVACHARCVDSGAKDLGEDRPIVGGGTPRRTRKDLGEDGSIRGGGTPRRTTTVLHSAPRRTSVHRLDTGFQNTAL